MQLEVLRDVALDILLFPVWWYSRGLLFVWRWSWQTLQDYVEYFALRIWIQNIFVPMFGQYDWQSRLISIAMRTVQIVGRSVFLVGILCGLLILNVMYLTLPICSMLFALYHLLGSLLYVA